MSQAGVQVGFHFHTGQSSGRSPVGDPWEPQLHACWARQPWAFSHDARVLALTPLLSMPPSAPPAATLKPSCCRSLTLHPFPPQNLGSCRFLCPECSSASSLHDQVLLFTEMITSSETCDHPPLSFSHVILFHIFVSLSVSKIIVIFL